ncbi:TAFII28-domain-containing protein [Zopfia rhizophila CBS 207.26]|uniref:TAFII28-domain-containing protein n=1 Tax=Zopfia rhizophila CBS 207.26 TaxID=1314779 RepID=A0A6A6ETR3_9PEZI|nr:TAFII28-domain-containing protein [Zopfia rhizophila CBS 207.26]
MASPPHLPSLNIPRKRPSVSSVQSANKKRKPSNLRNSFAPETEIGGSPLHFSRSPSVDSVATTSVTNGVGGKKKRRKDGDERSVTGTSIRGGKARSEVRSTTGVDDAGEEEEGDEDEDDEDEGEGMELEGGKMDEASEKREQEAMRILMEAMDENQTTRYETYRRVKLKKEILRKITNQTLSQSVPQPVIIVVNGYTKTFIGELIDRAITVRDEWCAARTHLPNPNLPLPLLTAGLEKPSNHNPNAKPSPQDIQAAGLYPNQVDPEEGYWKEVGEETPLSERLKMTDKGPLTPAHLREALRRYKRDREGGGAGFAGLSLEGAERTAGRLGGKRLFR